MFLSDNKVNQKWLFRGMYISCCLVYLWAIVQIDSSTFNQMAGSAPSIFGVFGGLIFWAGVFMILAVPVVFTEDTQWQKRLVERWLNKTTISVTELLSMISLVLCTVISLVIVLNQ